MPEAETTETPAENQPPPPPVEEPKPQTAAERRRAKIDATFAKIAEKNAEAQGEKTEEAPADGEEKPAEGDKPDEKPEEKAETEAKDPLPQLSKRQQAQLAAMLENEPGAVEFLGEFLKQGNVERAFISMKEGKKAAKETLRAAEREKAEAQRIHEEAHGVLDQWESLQKRLKTEPLKVLREYGLSMRELAEDEVANPTVETDEPETESEAMARIRELEEKLEERNRRDETAGQEAQVAAAKSEIRSNAIDHKERFPSLFEYVATDLETNGHEASDGMCAREIAEAVWLKATAERRETGRTPSILEVLEELDERADSWLTRAHERRSRSKDRRPPSKSGPSERGNRADPAKPASAANLTSEELAYRGETPRPKSRKERRDQAFERGRRRAQGNV